MENEEGVVIIWHPVSTRTTKEGMNVSNEQGVNGGSRPNEMGKKGQKNGTAEWFNVKKVLKEAGNRSMRWWSSVGCGRTGKMLDERIWCYERERKLKVLRKNKCQNGRQLTFFASVIEYYEKSLRYWRTAREASVLQELDAQGRDRKWGIALTVHSCK